MQQARASRGSVPGSTRCSRAMQLLRPLSFASATPSASRWRMPRATSVPSAVRLVSRKTCPSRSTGSPRPLQQLPPRPSTSCRRERHRFLPLTRIAAERQSLAESRSALRAERSSLDAQISAHKDVLTKLASTRGTLNGQKAEIDARLQSALAVLPDDSRQSIIAACKEELLRRSEAHRVKAAALDQGRASAPAPDEAERQKTRVDRFTSALESQIRTRDDLRQSIARLEGEVQDLRRRRPGRAGRNAPPAARHGDCRSPPARRTRGGSEASEDHGRSRATRAAASS